MRDPAGAAAAYIESVDVGRRLAALDPADTRTRASLAVALYKLGETKRKAGDKDGARAAFSESLMVVEKLEQERRLSDEQRDWPKVLRKAIADLDTVQNR
jgi:hypothetical protein